MFSRKIFAAALLALIAPASGALAATTTTSMPVSITITNACTISVTPLVFTTTAGTTLSSAYSTTTGGVFSYQCTPNGLVPGLTYGNGNNFSGTNRMKGTGGTFIPYSLSAVTLVTPTGAVQTATIPGLIPAQASIPAVDTYTDSVVLTLTY